MSDPAELLNKFFKDDPLTLTREVLDAGIARFRAAREQFKLGKKEPKTKEPKKTVNLDELEIE